MPRTTSRRRLTLLLGTLAALGPFTIDTYLPSFPALAASLGVDVAAVQLTLSTYLAGLAVGQLAYGPLADRFGRRRPLLAGLSLYVIASVACALAPSLELLALARFIQALGGCAGMVISRAIVRDHFGERESALLFSSLMLVMGIAPIVAPLIGGQMIAVASWRWIFVLLVALGASLLAMVGFFLAESLPASVRVRRGPRDIAVATLGLLRDPEFLRLSFAGGAVQAAMFSYIAGSPFVLIELYGIPPDRYGLVFGANAVGLIAASQANRFFLIRFGVLRTLRGAVHLALLAYAALFAAFVLQFGLPVVLPLLFVGIAVVGFALPNSSAAAMAPHAAQAGLASALMGTLQSTCGAFASAAVSFIADGSARPMGGVMLGCGVVAALCLAGVRRK